MRARAWLARMWPVLALTVAIGIAAVKGSVGLATLVLGGALAGYGIARIERRIERSGRELTERRHYGACQQEGERRRAPSIYPGSGNRPGERYHGRE